MFVANGEALIGVIVTNETSSNFSSGDWYATNDGGATWTHYAAPSGGVVASAGGRLWLVGGWLHDALYASTDDGATWARVTLPTSIAIGTGLTVAGAFTDGSVALVADSRPAMGAPTHLARRPYTRPMTGSNVEDRGSGRYRQRVDSTWSGDGGLAHCQHALACTTVGRRCGPRERKRRSFFSFDSGWVSGYSRTDSVERIRGVGGGSGEQLPRRQGVVRRNVIVVRDHERRSRLVPVKPRYSWNLAPSCKCRDGRWSSAAAPRKQLE